MNKSSRMIKWLVLVLNLFLLVSGWFYEEPYAARKPKLLLISLSFLLFSCVIVLINKKQMWQRITSVVMGLLMVGALEYFSKYAMDYFYHTLYLILMIYLLVYYPKREGLILGVITTAVSFFKFIELLIIQPNIGNLSVFIFYGVIQILILIIAIIARNYFEEGQKTKEIYLKLLDTYKQLEDSTQEIQRLSMEKERTKIARDLHDTLGHDLTGLIMQIEMSSRMISQEKYAGGLEILETAKTSSRESLTRVRQIVQALKSGEAERRSIESVKAICSTFSEKTGTDIQVEVIGKHSISPEIGIAVYRLVQESLTNAVRHGKASGVEVQIAFKEEEVLVIIKDNGKGCNKLVEGNGISGMRHRVVKLDGELTVSGFSDGFMIKAEIPYFGKDNNDIEESGDSQ